MFEKFPFFGGTYKKNENSTPRRKKGEKIKVSTDTYSQKGQPDDEIRDGIALHTEFRQLETEGTIIYCSLQLLFEFSKFDLEWRMIWIAENSTYWKNESDLLQKDYEHKNSRIMLEYEFSS